MRFTLTIELGKQRDMQTALDIAGALENISKRLQDKGIGGRINYPVTSEDDGIVSDPFGNRVGEWKIEAESKEQMHPLH